MGCDRRPRVKSTPSTGYKEFCAPRARDLVASRFAEDIETFGYDYF